MPRLQSTGRAVDPFRLPRPRQSVDTVRGLREATAIIFDPVQQRDAVMSATVAIGSVAVTLLLYRSIPCPASLTLDKQWYVKANLTKAVLLGAYSPWAAQVLWRGVLANAWSNELIHALSILYATPDLVSLFLVRRMSKTTLAHHLFVVAFAAVSLCNDYTVDNVCRSIVVYACFSTFSYSVNAVLGLRFVTEAMPSACFVVAATVYATCMGVNWVYQLWYMASHFSVWTTAAHASAISIIVVDDIVLLKWLVTQSSSARSPRLCKKSA